MDRKKKLNTTASVVNFRCFRVNYLQCMCLGLLTTLMASLLLTTTISVTRASTANLSKENSALKKWIAKAKQRQASYRQLSAKPDVLETNGLKNDSSFFTPVELSKIQNNSNFQIDDITRLPASLPATQVAQGGSFIDVQGHWAQAFIESLAAKDIIAGYPDGTYRPDRPVTRAEFAAILRKAFPKQKVRRGAIAFVDVPQTYWGYEAIKEAYELGFLSGYPDKTFKPDQKISRVEALVSLISGLNFSGQKQLNLADYYDDAGDIPSYAINKVAIATEKRVVVNYDNVRILNPTRVATRADVAAFIYQALVNNGTLAELPASDPATAYIVGSQAPVVEQTAQSNAKLEEFLLPEPPIVKRVVSVGVNGTPGSSIQSPTAFGAEFGNFFGVLSYQGRTRFTQDDDGAIAVGFGLGDARKYAGLEVTFTSFSTFRRGFFDAGGVSLKLHRLITSDLAVAVGIENLATWGLTDSGTSGYGVITKYFELQDDVDKPFSSITASVGLGGGRFRSESDVKNGRDSINVFGSVGVRLVRPISFIADWSGQDLALGLSIAPFRNLPLTINPAFVDVTGNAGDGPRFVLGVGYGLRF